MFTTAAQFKGLVIRATDGELGTVDQLYFDDETWAIRYLTVDTGGWLGARHVLISPMSIAHTDWPAKRLDVALTKKQVEKSPDINTHLPVSRQHEAAFSGITGIHTIGAAPICGAPPSTRRAWQFQQLPGKRWRIAYGENRPIRICVVAKPLPAITSTQLMENSVTWSGFFSTMKPGLSVTSRWRRGIGGRARRY